MINFKGIQFAPDFQVRTKKNFAKAQDYIDGQCLRYLPDYTPISKKGGFTKKSHKKWVPFENRGKMSKSHTIESPGVIINTEPTAREEYYTNKGFSGQGKLWLERMKADHAEDILKGLKKQL